MDDNNKLAFGIAWYVIFLFSTVVHEAGHALAARWGGDPTADDQVTLDPIPHIRREPFGMVLVPWLMFLSGGWMMGWASTPFDPFWAARHPHRAGLMALAGPLGNLLLAVIGGVAIKVGIAQQWLAPGANTDVALMLLLILFQLNVILFAFNLMPFPPLDGASVITLLMPEAQARSWQEQIRNPYISMLTLVGVWMLFPQIIRPIMQWAMHLLKS